MKKIKYFMLFIISAITMSGCMDIQDSYDYKPTPIDNKLYMSTWEYIEANSKKGESGKKDDMFYLLKRAIIHAELEDVYTQTQKKYTYLLLKNDAFTHNSYGILSLNNVSDIDDLDKELLKNILLYHTVNGSYQGIGNSSSTLTFDPIFVITLWQSELAIMTLKLSTSIDVNYYSRLQVNDLAGTSTVVTAVTSNMISTNGIIHIFERQIIYKP